ncbi:unnamed protein product [Rhizopus stolonifer]
MQKYFNTTDTIMNASLSIFTFLTAFCVKIYSVNFLMISYLIQPLVWAILSDRLGRRYIYLISFSISVIGSICCALSVNIKMFIAFRAVSAIGSSSVMSMGAGTIADIFNPQERGRAFAYYSCGPLLGPALGPIIGGYLNTGLGWSSNFWFLAIFGLCILVAIFFLLPETRPGEKSRGWYLFSSLKPIICPNIALCIVYCGILFFALYLNNTILNRVYANQYGLSSGLVGLCYLPMALGAMIGGVLGGKISDKIYTRSKARVIEGYPEQRLSILMLGSMNFLQAASLIAYGWCIDKNVHMAYSLVCQFIYGFASMFPNVTILAYMSDCFKAKSASVMACNNFVRYIMAGIGSLIASDLDRAIGKGPMFTMCGGLLIVFFLNIVCVKKYHKKWNLT